MSFIIKNGNSRMLGIKLLNNLKYQVYIGNKLEDYELISFKPHLIFNIRREEAKKYNFLESYNGEFINIFLEKVKVSEICGSIEEYRKKRLYDEAIPLLDKYSKMLGIPYKSLSIVKSKSFHGQCTHDQHIRLNIDLLHYSKDFFEYVIIHEVCHLQEKHHKKPFWELVESFCPNYKNIRLSIRHYTLLEPGIGFSDIEKFKNNLDDTKTKILDYINKLGNNKDKINNYIRSGLKCEL